MSLMKIQFVPFYLLMFLFIGQQSLLGQRPTISSNYMQEHQCSTSPNKLVGSYLLKSNGKAIGHSIWMSRYSKKVKAKYFAHKSINNRTTVYDRYLSWRKNKNVLLITSGAYATGWNGSDIPAGLTIDNGIIVNRTLDREMDALVIVEAVGGIRVVNLEDQNITIYNKYGTNQINIHREKSQFIDWASSNKATVFQSHLLIFKNRLKVSKYNSSNSKSVRKALLLVKDRYNNIYHTIYYTKHQSFTLYEFSRLLLNHMTENGMAIIAAVNLDTGRYDVMSSGQYIQDCRNRQITGNSNDRTKSMGPKMTNLLCWYITQ